MAAKQTYVQVIRAASPSTCEDEINAALQEARKRGDELLEIQYHPWAEHDRSYHRALLHFSATPVISEEPERKVKRTPSWRELNS